MDENRRYLHPFLGIKRYLTIKDKPNICAKKTIKNAKKVGNTCTNQIAIPLNTVTCSKLFAHLTICALKNVKIISSPIIPITESLNSGGFSKKVTKGK
jgi:hypothetical protein